MKKTIFKVFVIVFLLILLAPKAVFAASNESIPSSFSTDYDVTYTIKESGLTRVNFDVSLTNKTTEYYASSYSIKVGFENIENAKASDPGGQIVPYITKSDNGQEIELTFNSRVVGINNRLNFNLSFDTKEVAKKVGRLWEVNIPGLAEQGNFQTFNVHVRVPDSFGKPSYIKPDVIPTSRNNLDFTKENLGKSGIYIGFGDYQIYKFNLVYHVQNPNLFKVKTEIAIPPTTNYQDIEIKNIKPAPLNVRIDNDGNWLAEYLLNASQKINVVVEGNAKLFLNPKKEVIEKEKLKEYLKEQPYWETSNIDIKKLAQELKTPYAIYEYLVKNLTYDLSRVTAQKDRLGGANVLKNPKSAVCLEFTDLFIALSRAAGIPAREIDGFAYTEDDADRPLSLVKDILHAWPEYYDYEREAWIMIDPTWGNTTRGLDYFHTFDFDHFAFVIKGESSEYPIAAGGYKIEGDAIEKDVIVGFSNAFGNAPAKFNIIEDFPGSNFSGFPIKGRVTVRNTGGQISELQTATIYSKIINPNFQEISINKIPPLGFLTVDVSFDKTPILTNTEDTITITLNGQSISKKIKIVPIFLHKLSIILGGVIVVIVTIILSIIAVKTRRLPFFRQKEQNIVRWESEKSQKSG
ncbi:MAG: hypothetical protein A3D74_04380 [Candidatus Levybacteria bacterium RIFCSPHIGHO2_02_FULL_37_13]|nr:MAG: hypothetical protein A3D74_04380 [Candidatus Levybacteria bacterium RIFCSPHIGHO2_02_FULL_37_13]OGH30610.1 MAG: hypothetical protein A3E40_01675 [Candidatus Levybacteria bacterium RIFCSPHIGHO2_12_FULL_37_9]OGH40532.1 MAG: hypothetical protein A3B41_02850 [Candidatus Levybacteria bacterium RIFCSPLOWO2_01_FULL_37_26]